MSLPEAISTHLLTFMLAAFRLAGLFLITPLLASFMIPARFKVLLIAMLAAAFYPMLPARLDPDLAHNLDLFSLAPIVFTETLVGFCIGLIASVPLLALEMSGVMMGQQMGLGLARVYNPEADYDVDVLGQLLTYTATGVFFGTGGLEHLFQSVIHTFDRLPLGTFDSADAPLELLVQVLASAFELAMRVSAPVTATILLLVILFGAVGKTMPQINIMSVGFAVKIFVGLIMVVAASYAIQQAAGELVIDTLRVVDNWALGRPTGRP